VTTITPVVISDWLHALFEHEVKVTTVFDGLWDLCLVCSLVVEDAGGVTKDFEVVSWVECLEVVTETDDFEVECFELVAWVDLEVECSEVAGWVDVEVECLEVLAGVDECEVECLEVVV